MLLLSFKGVLCVILLTHGKRKGKKTKFPSDPKGTFPMNPSIQRTIPKKEEGKVSS
jgi:hypothetical protein